MILMQRSYTVEDARDYVEANLADIVKGYHESKEVPPWARGSQHMLECWKAGCWLNAMLVEHGASEREVMDIGFCHGQRSAFAPADHTWRWAVHYLNDFVAFKSIDDRPGIELADKIIRVYLPEQKQH